MNSKLQKYFGHLNMVREDIREEIALLDLPRDFQRICDFGCGNGLTTFALALEREKSDCFGIDLYESEDDLNLLLRNIEGIRQACKGCQSSESVFIGDLCKLHQEGRLPKFNKGNIVLNQAIPKNIDLAYCKKLLVNIKDKQYPYNPGGEKALLLALKNITECLTPGGKLCAIEYDREFELERYFESSRLSVIKRIALKRREIRSRGRTNVVSKFTLYLCQKQG